MDATYCTPNEFLGLAKSIKNLFLNLELNNLYHALAFLMLIIRRVSTVVMDFSDQQTGCRNLGMNCCSHIAFWSKFLLTSSEPHKLGCIFTYSTHLIAISWSLKISNSEGVVVKTKVSHFPQFGNIHWIRHFLKILTVLCETNGKKP